MSEDDLRTIVRAVKEAQAQEFDSLHEEMFSFHQEMEALHSSISEAEMGIMNAIRELSRRIDRHIRDRVAHREV